MTASLNSNNGSVEVRESVRTECQRFESANLYICQNRLLGEAVEKKLRNPIDMFSKDGIIHFAFGRGAAPQSRRRFCLSNLDN
jgi:hypothetical protein